MYDKEKWINYIYNSNIEAVKYLLDNKLIDINIQDEDGTTPLMYASYWNKIEIVKLLLNHPDINIFLKDDDGKTALDWVKQKNYKEIESLLINHDRKEKLKLI
jgi:hypothetical protein